MLQKLVTGLQIIRNILREKIEEVKNPKFYPFERAYHGKKLSI
jgi:hypothetical protein